jgi:hypothetical protein
MQGLCARFGMPLPLRLSASSSDVVDTTSHLADRIARLGFQRTFGLAGQRGSRWSDEKSRRTRPRTMTTEVVATAAAVTNFRTAAWFSCAKSERGREPVNSTDFRAADGSDTGACHTWVRI